MGCWKIEVADASLEGLEVDICCSAPMKSVHHALLQYPTEVLGESAELKK